MFFILFFLPPLTGRVDDEVAGDCRFVLVHHQLIPRQSSALIAREALHRIVASTGASDGIVDGLLGHEARSIGPRAALHDAAEEHETHAAGPALLGEGLVAARALRGAGVVVTLGGGLWGVSQSADAR